MSASVLPNLKQLTVQMRQLGEHLPPYAGVLDPDNIAYIRDTSAALIDVLDGLSAQAGNPLRRPGRSPRTCATKSPWSRASPTRR